MIRISKLIATTILILSFVVFSNVSFAQENGDKKEIKNVITLGKINLKDKVTAEVNDLIVAPNGDQKVVGMTLKVTNNSSNEINMLDYWVNLYTKSGSKLKVRADDSSKQRIPAKTTKSILFYATADKEIKASDLIVKLSEWDSRTLDYTKVLGEVSVPQRYDPVTPASAGRMVNIEETNVSFLISQANIGKSEKYYRPKFDLVIQNKGKSSVTIPDYQLYIVTDEELLFPLDTGNLKGTKLDPLMDKKLTLTTSIPLDAKVDNLKLIVMYPLNEGKDKLPVAVFELPKGNVTSGSDLNIYYTFANSNGTYDVKLNSFNRLPIEDNDLIVANVTLKNSSTESLAVPDLTGKMIFNENIEKDATAVTNKKVMAIAPGESIDLQFSSLIHYTFDVKKIKLNIGQKDSESESPLELVSFSYSGEFDAIPIASPIDGFMITETGYRSAVHLGKTKIFKNDNGSILASQIIVTNQEKRQAELQQLAGYFEKEDGTIYPAAIETVSDKLTPGGKALLYAWALVPPSEKFEDIRLVLGKAVMEVKSTNQDTQTNLIGYVNPYAIQLPNQIAVMNHLQGVQIEPYTLSIKRVKTQLNFQEGSLALTFDYELQQDLLMKASMKDHKIVIELLDADKKSVFRKAFEIAGEDKENSLSLGENTADAVWIDQDFVMGIQTLKEFDFNIYHEFQPGYRELIATQKIPWLVNRTLTD